MFNPGCSFKISGSISLIVSPSVGIGEYFRQKFLLQAHLHVPKTSFSLIYPPDTCRKECADSNPNYDVFDILQPAAVLQEQWDMKLALGFSLKHAPMHKAINILGSTSTTKTQWEITLAK